MICSALQQRIKSGHYFELISLDDSVPSSFSDTPSRKNIVTKLKSVFGNSIRFESFDHACTHSYGPVGFIFEEFMEQDPSAYEFIKTNESRSNLYTRIQNEINSVDPAFVNGKHNPRHQVLPRKLDTNLRGSGKFLLTKKEYNLLKDFIEHETEILNKVTGLDLTEKSIQFSEPIM